MFSGGAVSGGSEESMDANVDDIMGGFGFEEDLFTDRAVHLIHKHSSSAAMADDSVRPFFLYYAMHLLHSPLCAPPKLLDRFAFIDHEDRRYVAAMAYAMDAAVGRVVSALEEASMWERTLFVWSSDNGAAIELVTGAKSAYPLRGGYYTNWEGGIRAPGVVSGGWLPTAAAGTVVDGLIHLCDWYATFCALAGVDPFDTKAAKALLPPIDSLNVWPLISGANATSPRTEVLLTPLSGDRFNGTNLRSGDAALISGTFKLIVGNISQASWCAPKYPNNTDPWDTWTTVHACTLPASSSEQEAKVGCLFNIYDDPGEHHDLAVEQPERAAAMLKRLSELDATVFDPNRGSPDHDGVCKQAAANGGYFGPWLGVGTTHAATASAVQL